MAQIYSNIEVSSRLESCDQIKVITVVWIIPNFTTLLHDTGKCILEYRTNKENYPETMHDSCKFLLKMQLVGHDRELVEIYYLPPVAIFVKSVLSLCLKCYKERTLVTKDFTMIPANKWQYLSVMFKKEIMNNPSNFLDEDTLNLKAQFTVNLDIKLDPSSIPRSQLSSDLQNLLNDTSFSDIILKSADGVEFPTHKAMLAGRSSVLKAHFEHNTKECHTNVIESPFKKEIIQEMLTYIYTDFIPNIDEMPVELLAAADFYQMARLKFLCEEALQKKLTVQNAIETLQLADLHSAVNLKKMTLEFIHDGHARLVTRTAGWENLDSVPLMKMVVEYILRDGIIQADDIR